MQKLSMQRFTRHGSRSDLAGDLEQVATGNVDAYIRVYRATSAKLFGIIVRILGRGEVAEEILQEVYLRVWQKAAEFNRERASPITWLATIARNRALDEGRKRKLASVEDMPELLDVPSGEDIERDHLALDEFRRLHQSLAGLQPEQRKIVELVYFEGLTRDEVARRIGGTTSSVNTLLKQSIQKLKDVLDP